MISGMRNVPIFFEVLGISGVREFHLTQGHRRTQKSDLFRRFSVTKVDEPRPRLVL
jgi:hypothetical protein